ncbi:MAG: FAD-dependent oxidoreductase [Planctomycetota bacterium]|nr:MAG: FAD-dependent oxidoreductase [Planctomycetota bacterium]
MAGRCISVTHEALGTVRVMKTCGMMGEVVGKAAAVCVAENCTPRDVYEKHWSKLDALMRLPGKARRATLNDPIVIPEDALPEAGPYGPPTGLDPAKLSGVVVDDKDARTKGNWTEGSGLKGYVGYGYLYASPDSGAEATFELVAPRDGTFSLRLAYGAHPNRGTAVPVHISMPSGEQVVRVNMREKPPLPQGFIELARVVLRSGQKVRVTLKTEKAGGIVHADAVQLLPLDR